MLSKCLCCSLARSFSWIPKIRSKRCACIYISSRSFRRIPQYFRSLPAHRYGVTKVSMCSTRNIIAGHPVVFGKALGWDKRIVPSLSVLYILRQSWRQMITSAYFAFLQDHLLPSATWMRLEFLLHQILLIRPQRDQRRHVESYRLYVVQCHVSGTLFFHQNTRLFQMGTHAEAGAKMYSLHRFTGHGIDPNRLEMQARWYQLCDIASIIPLCLKCCLSSVPGSFCWSEDHSYAHPFYSDRIEMSLPLGMLVVNLVGCLLIGLFFVYMSRGNLLDNNLRLFLTVGILRRLTTFSTFCQRMYGCSETPTIFNVALYVSITLVGGFLAVWLGQTIIKSRPVIMKAKALRFYVSNDGRFQAWVTFMNPITHAAKRMVWQVQRFYRAVMGYGASSNLPGMVWEFNTKVPIVAEIIDSWKDRCFPRKDLALD